MIDYDIVIGQRSGVRLGGAGGYVGPYDSIPSITAAYGMRRLRSAYTGNILRLRRSTDNVESDFGYVANGDLDTAAIAAWLGGASGYVATWYDQSGNGNHAVQSTAASQPLLVAGGVKFDGSDDWINTGVVQLAGMGLLVRLSDTANNGFAMGTGALNLAPARTGRRYTDGSSATISPSITAGVMGVGNSKGYYNGAVDATGMTGAASSSDIIGIGCIYSGGAANLFGAVTLHEIAIIAVAPSDAGYATITAIMEAA